jgi:Sgf11 (transcriptional regulation protein)
LFDAALHCTMEEDAPPRKRTRSAIFEERRILYPTLYDSKTDDEIQQILDQYVVEYETTSVSLTSDDIPSPPLDQTPPRIDPDPAADSVSSSTDIWGRHPPKEYSSDTLICTICQQKVGSSLRYASHLDKCLGIGTMSRGGNSAATSAAMLSKP